MISACLGLASFATTLALGMDTGGAAVIGVVAGLLADDLARLLNL